MGVVQCILAQPYVMCVHEIYLGPLYILLCLLNFVPRVHIIYEKIINLKMFRRLEGSSYAVRLT